MKEALILNTLVLLVVLEADMGRHRKINWFRILRPFVTSGVAIAFFIKAVTTSGTGLELEVALAAAGIVLGLIAVSLMGVYRSPQTHKPVSRAGAAYAGLWVVVIAARSAFSYGSVHWFGSQLDHWMSQHGVTSAALTDALLFMAIACVGAGSFSPTPGDVGVVEVTMTAALVAAGLPAPVALAAVLLYRIVAFKLLLTVAWFLERTVVTFRRRAHAAGRNEPPGPGTATRS